MRAWDQLRRGWAAGAHAGERTRRARPAPAASVTELAIARARRILREAPALDADDVRPDLSYAQLVVTLHGVQGAAAVLDEALTVSLAELSIRTRRGAGCQCDPCRAHRLAGWFEW